MADSVTKYQLSPGDGVLEVFVHLISGSGWIPYIPGGVFPLQPDCTWRRWLYGEVHDPPTRGHRDAARTIAILKRMCFWPSMVKDGDWWSATCEKRAKIRGQPQLVPQIPVLEEQYMGAWLDIYVDFQGPFPESVDGHRYICSYTCRLLRVPLLTPAKNVYKEEASLRSLTVPVLLRHDRGPEFGNCLLEEVCSLLEIKE